MIDSCLWLVFFELDENGFVVGLNVLSLNVVVFFLCVLYGMWKLLSDGCFVICFFVGWCDVYDNVFIKCDGLF